jgi:hypothetical protein
MSDRTQTGRGRRGERGDIDFKTYIREVARQLLGEPNKALSKRDQLRFGRHGSLAVNVGGPERGTFYDHEAKQGGGVLDLIRRETGLVNGAAIEWLRQHVDGGIPAPTHADGPAPRLKPSAAPIRTDKPVPKLGKPVAEWVYRQADGRPVMRVLRFHPGGDPANKTYRQERANGVGGWTPGVSGIDFVPYRLPDMAHAAGLVFVTEGEKAADLLVAAAIGPATCNPMGAGKWQDSLTPWFEGRDVVILPDNDKPGAAHAELVASALHGVAARIRIVHLPGLPEKGDAEQWLDAGGDGEELLRLVDATPDWRPPLGIWDRIRAIAPHSPSLQRLVDGDFSKLAGQRREQRDQALGSALKRAGFNFDEMREALIGWELGAGAERLADGREDYFEQIWDRAGRLVPDHIPLPNEEPLPLRRDTRPPLEFPLTCLPATMRDAVEAIQWRTQAPVAMCAQSVIAAASLAVQQHVNVVLPMGSTKPVSLFCISTAMSGERKSAVDELAVAPVRQWEAELAEEYRSEKLTYALGMEAYGAAKEAALKDKANRGDRDRLETALEQLGDPPQPPMLPIILADNLTVEGIERYFADKGRPSIGMFTAEGGKIIGGHMMSDENRMKAGATLNLLWDGATLNRFRSGDGAHRMPGKRLCVHIMVQPGVIEQLMTDRTLSDLGTLARFLVVVPPTTAGSRLWRETPVEVELALQAYSRTMLSVLRRPAAHGEAENELTPRGLHLDPEARAAWIRFHDEVEVKLKPGAEYDAIRPFGSKLAEHAARLAAVLAVFEDADAIGISAAMMEAGATLARHYAQEALRLVENGQSNQDLTAAEVLLAWLQEKHVQRFTLKTVYREGPTFLRDRDSAAKVVAVLEKHGWARRLPSGAEVDGKPSREAWEVYQGPRQGVLKGS